MPLASHFPRIDDRTEQDLLGRGPGADSPLHS